MSVRNCLSWLLEDLEKLVAGDIDPCREVFQTLEEYAQSIERHLDVLTGQDSQIPQVHPEMKDIEYPAVESHWFHRNGLEYEVVGFTNSKTTNPDKYPVTIIYSGKNGNMWSRPLSDWHRSMTPAPSSKE